MVNNFTYLQSLLQRKATADIAGLSLTTENYTTAKSIQEKRFGRKERIVFGHIQQLLKMQPISTNRSSNLWRLHDEIQANVGSLENIEVDGTTYGVVLTPLVLRQLPTHIRLEWARVGEGQEGNLTFHDEIQTNVRSLENLEVDGTTYGVVLTPLVLRQLPTHIRLEWARVGEGQEGKLTFHGEIRQRERERDHRLSTRCQTHRLVGVPDTLVCLNPRNTIRNREVTDFRPDARPID